MVSQQVFDLTNFNLMMFKAVLFLCSVIFAAVLAANKPNIILIITDDQGYGDLSITGSEIVETPHIDQIAKDGLWMEQFYVSSVCTPTRAALMTGRHPQRTGAYDTYIGRSTLHQSEYTMASALKAGGYSTGIFGKWHLGDHYPSRAMDHGFEESLVHFGGGLGQPSEPFPSPEPEVVYTDPLLSHNGELKKYQGYCTDVFFEEAKKFIANNKEQPFFAYVSLNAPHGPYTDVPEKVYQELLAKGVPDKEARIFSMIENIDANVGLLDEFLKKQGLYKNTVVMFMTDNGPNTRRYAGEFQGWKTTNNEGGVRTSFFLRWPDKVKAGSRNPAPVAHYDLYPTLLELAGLEATSPNSLDGVSFKPLVLNHEVDIQAWQQRPIILQWNRGYTAIKNQNFMVRQGDWKLLGNIERDGKVSKRLYEITKDWGETKDVKEKHPEIFTKLDNMYKEWLNDVSSTRPYNYSQQSTIIGTDRQTLTQLTPEDRHKTWGLGWGDQGLWHITAKQNQVYDITVIFKEKHQVPVGYVELAIGRNLYHERYNGEHKQTFHDVSISKGDHVIYSTLFNWGVGRGSNDAFAAPYQIIINRK